MRYFGTFMLLAAAAMLLLPAWWEGRDGTGTAPAEFTGRSTLTAEDLLPPWRGPSS